MTFVLIVAEMRPTLKKNAFYAKRNVLLISPYSCLIFLLWKMCLLYLTCDQTPHMADSSPLTLLAPKRQRLGTNWEKSIICQSNSNELLKEATENGLDTFVKTVSDRRDDVSLRLENRLAAIDCGKVVWHDHASRPTLVERISVGE